MSSDQEDEIPVIDLTHDDLITPPALNESSTAVTHTIMQENPGPSGIGTTYFRTRVGIMDRHGVRRRRPYERDNENGSSNWSRFSSNRSSSTPPSFFHRRLLRFRRTKNTEEQGENFEASEKAQKLFPLEFDTTEGFKQNVNSLPTGSDDLSQAPRDTLLTNPSCISSDMMPEIPVNLFQSLKICPLDTTRVLPFIPPQQRMMVDFVRSESISAAVEDIKLEVDALFDKYKAREFKNQKVLDELQKTTPTTTDAAPRDDSSNKGGLCDSPAVALKRDEKSDKQVVEPNKIKKKNNTVAEKEWNAVDEFDLWCIKSLSPWSSKIDVPTFVDFLKSIVSPFEVANYIKCYLGETKEAIDFRSDYLQKRLNLLRTGMATPSDQCPRPSTSSGYQNG